jgi:hypothetical protein
MKKIKTKRKYPQVEIDYSKFSDKNTQQLDRNHISFVLKYVNKVLTKIRKAT